MINAKITSLLLAGLFLTVSACKDDDAAPANTPPVITITSPSDAELEAGFNQGETVNMRGTVEDDKEIATLAIDVFYGTLDLGMDETIEVNEKTFMLDYSVEIPDSAPTGEYRVRITATDDEGAPATVDKTFHIH